jgi:hypothetical protein
MWIVQEQLHFAQQPDADLHFQNCAKDENWMHAVYPSCKSQDSTSEETTGLEM